MFHQDILQKLLLEIKEKNIVNSLQAEKYPDEEYYKLFIKSDIYFDAIKNEVEEVKNENTLNNSVYLEDELGDILWNYMNLLYFLEKEGKIKIDNVTTRCLKKYSERTQGLKNGILWNETKKIQKAELLQEHNNKYN